MKRKNAGAVMPAPTSTEANLVTEPIRQVGGPQSGLPPAYEIASELAPFLIVGIDFGTHDCRVATFIEKEPRSLKLGEIESKVHFDGYATDSEAVVATSFDVKNLLGKPVRIKVGESMFDPIDLTLPVLRRVKRDAEKFSEKLLAKAVITTPACATHSYRKELLEAASLAEINVVGLLNETTAVGLYWSYYVEPTFTGTFVAVSLGKTHWEAAVLMRHEKLLEVRAHACRPAPPVGAAVGEKVVIEELIQQLLDDSVTDATDVKVVITGGRAGGDMFDLPDFYRDVLPAARVSERLDYRAASAGAAIFAALIVRQTKDLAVWDCVATATMVGEEFSIKPLIAQQSPVPISGHFNFKATADKAQFQVVQRAGRESDARSVCCVVVEDIPATDAAPRNIDIEVHATADGVLSFNARDIQLDSNLRIHVEPVATEYDIIELVPIEEKQLDDVFPSSKDRFNEPVGQTGVIIMSVEGRWIVQFVLPNTPTDILPGMEVLEINGVAVNALAENPNAYLVGTPETSVEFKLRGRYHDQTYEMKLTCSRSIHAWDVSALQPIIADAVVQNDTHRLVTATIMYAHATFQTSPFDSEKAYDRAVELAQRELGTQDPLYTLAVARKAWFHLKQYLAFADASSPDRLQHHAGEMRRALLKLIATEVETATDAHAKYIFEIACTVIKHGSESLPGTAELLLGTVLAIAHKLNLPDTATNVYKQKLAEIRPGS